MSRHGFARYGPRGRRRRRCGVWSERAFSALLWLYPPSLRRAYGLDMRQAFRDTLRDETRRRGRPAGALRTWAITLRDLAASLPREWPREARRGWRPARRDRMEGRWRTGSTRSGWTVGGVLRSPGGRTAAAGRGSAAGWTWQVRRGRMDMNEKFDKFTERARRVMSLAQVEAQRFNHNYIGTEHLLLGLIAEGDGIGAHALARLGVELGKAREAVGFIIGRGDRVILGEIGLTPRAKRCVELAVDEARRMGHHYIGTEHLLLGIIREGEGIAAGVLESLGVSLEQARSAVIETLNGRGVATPGRPGSASMPSAGPLVTTITLICRDVAATQAFYVTYLGATPLPQGARGPALASEPQVLLRGVFGGPMFGLRAADPASAAAPSSGVGGLELDFFVHDIAALWNDLRQRGAPGLSDIQDLPSSPRMAVFTLTDPDGRALRFRGMSRA